MSEFDALPFVLSLAVLPVAAILIAHYVLWDLDRTLARQNSKDVGQRRRS